MASMLSEVKSENGSACSLLPEEWGGYASPRTRVHFHRPTRHYASCDIPQSYGTLFTSSTWRSAKAVSQPLVANALTLFTVDQCRTLVARQQVHVVMAVDTGAA